jgi:hypothetical protein
VQGIGIVGWHHYRAIPGETNIWNKGWDFGGARDGATADPFGVRDCQVTRYPYTDLNGNIRASFTVNFVDRYSAAELRRVASVRYDYIFEPSDVKCWVTFTEFPDGFDAGPTPYLKEPKYAVGIGASSYQPKSLTIFGSQNETLLAIDLVNDPHLQDPTHGTVQVPNGPRTRAAFYDAVDYLSIVAEGNSPLTYGADDKVTNYGTRGFWVGSLGLDAFAQDADTRSHFDDSVCAAYCLTNGKLTRKWEVAKRGGDPRTEIMFHGWEGGSGLPDCLCASRTFKSNTSWLNYFSVSRGPGWNL